MRNTDPVVILPAVLWGGWAENCFQSVFASTMNRWGNRWRLYDMLYTASSEGIERILQRTRYFVWNQSTFLTLTSAEVKAVQEEIRARFHTEWTIRDNFRTVTIYQ